MNIRYPIYEGVYRILTLEHWEKRFWLSEFSHLGGSRNPTESNLVSVTEKARTNPFDYNELKPMDRQLKDLLI